ncbi:ATP-dependent 3'-5' DNA helicase, partial [Teratosphaeriaceae sp. CCFEE 6253]
MVKLQAATVSNQLVNKRKRKRQPEEAPEDTTSTISRDATPAAGGTTSSVPTKTHDGGKKARRTTKKGDKPPLVRQASSTVVETTLPWPDPFTALAQVHRALNLVYTFCCTRKHMATTFDNIKSAVEANIKRPVLIEDIARVKRLVPAAINFQYVDEAMLQVALMGEEDLRGGKRASDMFLESPAEERQRRAAEGKDEHVEVLLFEFVDGDLKRQVHNAKGEVVRAHKKLKEEELKMPVFSQKQMMKLIEKRN